MDVKMAPIAADTQDAQDTVMGEAGPNDNNDGRAFPADDLAPLLGPMDQRPDRTDVCVVGAGPTGLMLATLLTRFGIKVAILDERASQTMAGRADGVQPKTIETLKMLRLADELLRKGTKVFDICMWRVPSASKRKAGLTAEPVREGRQAHYPSAFVDLTHPFLLLCHQGNVEGVLADDLRRRGVEVMRSHLFDSYALSASGPLKVNCRWNVTHDRRTLLANYLVGCDGARSRVRKNIPGSFPAADPSVAPSSGPPQQDALVWGVLDGKIETDFPDIYSKTIVFSEDHGSLLIQPRERNLVRFYIEIKAPLPATGKHDDATPRAAQLSQQRYVMDRARVILAPFKLRWRSVEWFGHYMVAQRVAAKFADPCLRAFIAGDAAHTHSPKAAQGLNTGVHDAWNLGWKINLAARGLAKPVLLQSYEEERRKIANDLVEFGTEHAKQIASGNTEELSAYFRTNVRFISGVGAEYHTDGGDKTSVLNQGSQYATGAARPGCTLPPGKVSRYVDDNPVDLQTDMPVLGQFRVYVFVEDARGAIEAAFLQRLGDTVAGESSLMRRLSAAAYKSYLGKPRIPGPEILFIRPERYTWVSHLFTFALVTSTPKDAFEVEDLPPLFAQSKWTVYLDNVPHLDTQAMRCTDKYLGGRLSPGEVVILNVRPDGYLGSMRRWVVAEGEGSIDGEEAARWLDEYYGQFLTVADE